MRLIATRVSRKPLMLALFAAIFALAAGRVQAQVNPLWDHYKGYVVANHPTFNTQVTLTDQFQTTVQRTQYLDWFANPVEKQHGPAFYPINRPELHYTWWALSARPAVPRDVIATNQFGDHVIHVGVESHLLNPALKNAPAGTPLPLANHYLCYECTGDPIDVPLVLTDQFYQRTAVHLVPRYFCNPVRKVTEAGVVYPIMDPAQHYTVYDLTDFSTTLWNASFQDQFMNFPLQLLIDRLLMVPTIKTLPTGTTTDTWGRLKSLYR